MSEHVTALRDMPAGSRVRILEVHAGSGLKSRLTALRLLPGTELVVARNAWHGPLIVCLKGNRLVLGRGLTRKIAVKFLGAESPTPANGKSTRDHHPQRGAS